MNEIVIHEPARFHWVWLEPFLTPSQIDAMKWVVDLAHPFHVSYGLAIDWKFFTGENHPATAPQVWRETREEDGAVLTMNCPRCALLQRIWEHFE